MKTTEAKSVHAVQRSLVIRAKIPHVISPSVDGSELFCERRVEFRELPSDPWTEDSNDGIRIYGSHECAVLQLRGISALTDHGKPRRLIATATYLDKREVHALIAKLTEIEATLPAAKATEGSAMNAAVLPNSVLSEYPAMTACLRYRDGSGQVKDWFIRADPNRDNEKTLRAHLHRHLPAAELVGWAIK